MKKLFLASSLLAGMSATASAADLPRRFDAPPAYAPLPVFTWTGFYLGANAGYGFNTGNTDRTTTTIGVTPATGLFQNNTGSTFTDGQIAFANRQSTNGFVGGAQAGYNYQFTPGRGVVVGVETDIQYAGFGGRNRFAANAGSNGGAVTPGGLVPGTLVFNPNGQQGLDYFGTVRGRLGYAFDRTLLYATGGFAYGGGGDDSGLPSGFGDSTKLGWTAGGGVEYALPTTSFLNFLGSSAVTLKLEGLYVNLENDRRLNGAFAQNSAGRIISIGDPGTALAAGSTVSRSRDTEFAVVRAGLNYKFGSY